MTTTANASDPSQVKRAEFYEQLLKDAGNDPKEIQNRYSVHRSQWVQRQRTKLLDPGFPGFSVDHHLAKLVGPNKDPTFVDERSCFDFWALPPKPVQELVHEVQERIRRVAPQMWFMPKANLHMTQLEILSSSTDTEVERHIEKMTRPCLRDIADYTFDHRSLLVKPLISYDAAALALTFVPAAGEDLGFLRNLDDDKYTYHHLRRDVHVLTANTGLPIEPRYVHPTAHLTFARHITQDGLQTTEEIQEFVTTLDKVNEWLVAEHWPKENGVSPGGFWFVGEEFGLDARKYRSWYGGGVSEYVGKSFSRPVA